MKTFVIFNLLIFPLLAQTPNAVVDRLLDRIVEREKVFLDSAKMRTPVIETYIQEAPESAPADDRPTKDHYFLGRFRLGDALAYETLIERSDAPPPKSGGWHSSQKNRPMTFLPRGFAQMAVVDLQDFNRQTYSFEYVRREFLGEVRCLVF